MNKQEERLNRLIPNGIPRYIRCYDNGGKTFDRYTVVYSGRYSKTPGWFDYVGMSGKPFHPQGLGNHGQSQHQPVDRPSYGHLGKKIKFEDLPEDCKTLVTRDYKENWNLK